MVKEIFSRVASKYDVMNDVMSLGAHRLWKDDLINRFGLQTLAKANPNYIPRHLDVAGGTGDIAFRSLETMLKEYASHSTITNTSSSTAASINTTDGHDECSKQIVVCDINPDMLAVGKSRALSAYNRNMNLIGFVEGNAEKLSMFPDSSFDIYTIAFGLRNVTDKDAALREAYRILKPGGKIMIMEFSKLTNPIMQSLYDQYSFKVIPKLGEAIANDSDSYQYLVESIQRFPTQEKLNDMVKDAGFMCCSYVNLTFGVVAIHTGYKI